MGLKIEEASIELILEDVTPELKRLECEADHAYISKVMDGVSILPLPHMP
jgi:hypothetical protein